MSNPYQPVQTNSGGMPPGKGETSAATRVKGPGIALMVVAGIFIVVLVGASFFNVFLLLSANVDMLARQGLSGATVVTIRIGAGLALIALNAIVFLGANNMRQLKNFSMSRTAAIIAVIPCCGPCYFLGIPFGIWALVVLADPSVKAAFKS